MKQIHILLVEDNEGDIVLTQETFKDFKMLNTHSVVRDGEEAINYLKKKDEFTNALTPDFIFLDINLPKIDGKEVLSFLKNDEKLCTIPVVMLTTSSSQIDIADSQKNNANGYLIKPLDVNKFLTVLGKLQNFAISIVDCKL
jgi:two-component system, chemotaxis family, response regulator Rcp1